MHSPKKSYICGRMKRLSIIFAVLLFCLSSRAQVKESSYIETWAQYAPMAADLALGVFGADAGENFLGRTLELGISFVIDAAIVDAVLKNVVDEVRPDGSAHNSFPSGHTSTAFVGAELVRLEYGWGWGAGAYAVATGVGVMRVVHQRHYWWDVLAGAGVGILSANVGRWCYKPLGNCLGLRPEAMQMSLTPSYDPVSGVPTATFALRF